MFFFLGGGGGRAWDVFFFFGERGTARPVFDFCFFFLGAGNLGSGSLDGFSLWGRGPVFWFNFMEGDQCNILFFLTAKIFFSSDLGGGPWPQPPPLLRL
jgi:hypothetical protein